MSMRSGRFRQIFLLVLDFLKRTASREVTGNGKFRLGEWTVEPYLDRISRGGEHVALQPQVMDLLVYLARHRKEVIGTDELLEQIWPDRIVTKASIYSSLKQLRDALGDDAHDPRFIKTIPKRGYRLIAEVDFAGDAVSPGPASSKWELMPPRVWMGGGALVLLILVLITFFSWPGLQTGREPAQPPTADQLYRQALPLVEQNTKNTLAAAVMKLQRALDLNPDFPEAHIAIARAYQELTNFDGYYPPGTGYESARELARHHVESALSIDPENADAWAAKAGLSVAASPDRLAALEKALELNPEHFEAQLDLGITKLSYLTPWSEVITHIDRAADIDPMSLEAATTLVLFLAWTPHRWDEAESIIANLELREPESVDVLMAKALWLLNPVGHPAKAIPIFETILMQDPDHSWARSFLTKAWYMVGEYERAYRMPGGIIHWKYVLSPDRKDALDHLDNTPEGHEELDYGRRIIASYAYVMRRDWQSAIDLLGGESGDLDAFSRVYCENFVLNESPALSLATAYKALGDQQNFERFAGLEQMAVEIRSSHGRLHNYDYSRTMARLFALRGNHYEALLELERLVSLGPIDPRELLHPAFDELRGEPGFIRVMQIQRSRVNGQRQELNLPQLEPDNPLYPEPLTGVAKR